MIRNRWDGKNIEDRDSGTGGQKEIESMTLCMGWTSWGGGEVEALLEV